MRIIYYIIGGIVFVAVIGFGYYAISPLFLNIKADEALPGIQTAVGQKEAMIEGGAIMKDAITDKKGAEVVGTTGHPASGTVRIVSAAGKNYVRYENFKTINGPDIYVYLSKDLKANDFVSLGKVRATEGNVNYEIPDTVNPADYPYVLTWCKTFGVLFNSARIN